MAPYKFYFVCCPHSLLWHIAPDSCGVISFQFVLQRERMSELSSVFSLEDPKEELFSWIVFGPMLTPGGTVNVIRVMG